MWVRRSRTLGPDFTPLSIAQQAAGPVPSPAAAKADGRLQKDTLVVKNYKVVFYCGQEHLKQFKLREAEEKVLNKDYSNNKERMSWSI